MCELGAARDPDGRNVGLRLDGDVVQVVVGALEGHVAALEKRPRRLENLFGACASLLARAASRLELGRVPTGSDAVYEPAAAQVLQGGDLFGQHYRLACRQHENRGGQVDPGGGG